MSQKIKCQCSQCGCSEEFESIDKELLLNLITHGRVDVKREEYLTNRVGNNLCKNFFHENIGQINKIRLKTKIGWN